MAPIINGEMLAAYLEKTGMRHFTENSGFAG